MVFFENFHGVTYGCCGKLLPLDVCKSVCMSKVKGEGQYHFHTGWRHSCDEGVIDHFSSVGLNDMLRVRMLRKQTCLSVDLLQSTSLMPMFTHTHTVLSYGLAAAVAKMLSHAIEENNLNTQQTDLFFLIGFSRASHSAEGSHYHTSSRCLCVSHVHCSFVTDLFFFSAILIISVIPPYSPGCLFL